MSKVISLLSSKGGAGKTTISTNLSQGLFRMGKRVLVAASDPQASSRDWSLQAPDEYNMVPVLGVGAKTMEKEIASVRDSYDYIIIDGAAKMEAAKMVPTIKVSDLVLVPVQPSSVDIWAIEDLIDVLKARLDAVGKPLVNFLISRQITGTVIAGDVFEVLKEKELPILNARTSQRVVFAEALSAGLSVYEAEPDGKAQQEIEALIEEVTGLIDG